VLGLLAFWSRYALTFGETQIDPLLARRAAATAFAVAALAKLAGTSVTLSSGWRGGFIIPLFFLGVVLGTVASRQLHTDPVVTVVALMSACNVGVTKTPFGSTLVVTGMAGVALLPTTLLASVVALVLTSRVSLIDTQRERDPVVA
jgi:H+/Cl- antiporter ClcA